MYKSIGRLVEKISIKVAAYGQFVLVYTVIDLQYKYEQDFLDRHFCTVYYTVQNWISLEFLHIFFGLSG